MEPKSKGRERKNRYGLQRRGAGWKMTIRYRPTRVKVLDTASDTLHFLYPSLRALADWQVHIFKTRNFTLLALPWSDIELTYVLGFLGFILFSYKGTCRGIPRGVQQWSFRNDLPAWLPFAATTLLAALLFLPRTHDVRFHPRSEFNPKHQASIVL